MNPGAEACKRSLCSRRTLTDIVLVVGDRILALHVNLVHVLLLSIQIRRAETALCEAMTALMLVISSQRTRVLELVLRPLEVLLAPGMILTEKALACPQCHDLRSHGPLSSQKISIVGTESHQCVKGNKKKDFPPQNWESLPFIPRLHNILCDLPLVQHYHLK
jgi:hypothetical protein